MIEGLFLDSFHAFLIASSLVPGTNSAISPPLRAVCDLPESHPHVASILG
jgi:hypothetical protein